MRSVMKHLFSEVPAAKIPRSAFNRSFTHKTTFDAGYLIPVMVDMAYPGDTFNLRMHAFARLATPIVPVMDNIFMDSFFFAVPIRLVWDNFQKFMGEQRNPGDSTDYLVPVMTAPAVGGHAIGSLSDYMGIPTGINSLEHISLFHRAYNLIWNEWFRDENLQNSVVVDVDDGPDTSTDYSLLRRGKRHDYFTSCLPWPQKGDDVLAFPIGTEAPLKSRNSLSGSVTNNIYVRQASSGQEGLLRTTAGTLGTTIQGDWTGAAGANYIQWQQSGESNDATAGGYNYADLSDAAAATINNLRLMFAIQRLYEKDARGGTRYTEIIRSHFGVISPDARLQRPEYLGGGSTPVNFHPIAQTSSTDATTPQGNLAAMATARVEGHGFIKSFTEHTLIIGLVSVRADLTYQKGLDRMFSLSSRWDFYWPELAHIGEQAVLNKEIWADGSANDDLVFGYQERYAELRYKPSKITGLFRSDAAGTLDIWHLSQDFNSLPVLNSSFIQDDPPLDRVIATPSEPHFLFDSYFDMKCVRPMPLYGVPGMTRL